MKANCQAIVSPKKWTKGVWLYYVTTLQIKKKQIRSFVFWRIYGLTICFRNQLTFNMESPILGSKIGIKICSFYDFLAKYLVGRKKNGWFQFGRRRSSPSTSLPSLWSLLGTKSRSHGKPCKSQYHLQSTPFHFTLFFSILFILPLFRKFLQLLILDYSESPNNISISMAHGLTCFFLKEIARIPPFNMVFIRNKISCHRSSNQFLPLNENNLGCKIHGLISFLLIK